MHLSPVRAHEDRDCGPLAHGSYPNQSEIRPPNNISRAGTRSGDNITLPLLTDTYNPGSSDSIQPRLSFAMERWLADTEGDRVVADNGLFLKPPGSEVPQSPLERTTEPIDDAQERASSNTSKKHEPIANKRAYQEHGGELSYLGAWSDNKVLRDKLRSVLEDLERVILKMRQAIGEIERADSDDDNKYVEIEDNGIDESNELELDADAEPWWEALVGELFAQEGKLNLA